MTAPTLRPPKLTMQPSADRRLAYFLLAAVCFLYLEVFILPDIPILAYGDQSVYLLNATRMLARQVMYRDFFEFTFPGTESVYVTLFKVFGVRAWIPDAMLVLLGVGLTWVSVVISKQLMEGPSVFLPGLLFLTFAFRSALDGTHHWYSTLAAVGALAVLLKRRSTVRLTAAGALCGLAVCFTQSEGLASIAALGSFLAWECHRQRSPWDRSLRKGAWLLVPFLGTVSVFNAYFVWKAGMERFLYCTVIFGVKYYPSNRFNTWRVYLTEMPSIHRWADWPALGIYLAIYALLPSVYILFFFRRWRTARAERSEPWDRLMLVNLMGVFMFLGVAPAPSYLRLCSVSLPAFILLVWLMKSAGRAQRALLHLLWAAALVLLVAEPAMRQTDWRAYLDLPTGRTAFTHPEEYEEYGWVQQHTRPSDFFFGDQLINFALDLRDPAGIDFISPTDYTRPSQVRNLVAALEKHRVRLVIWYRGLSRQGIGDRPGDHLDPVRAYVRGNYHVTKTFGRHNEIQAWKRNQQVLPYREPLIAPRGGGRTHYE